jgi:hypothetical protein
MSEQADFFSIAQLISAERHWRDTRQWDKMQSAYHSEAMVRTGWFQGSGLEFVEASKHAFGKSLSKHRLSPSIVRINEDRAIAETDTLIETRASYGEIEIDVIASCRLFSRVRRDGGIWRLGSLDAIYEKDSFSFVNPLEQFPLDWQEIAGYRPSYRFLCYFNQHGFGRTVDPDLPGDDRPELVTALYTQAEVWLQHQGG